MFWYSAEPERENWKEEKHTKRKCVCYLRACPDDPDDPAGSELLVGYNILIASQRSRTQLYRWETDGPLCTMLCVVCKVKGLWNICFGKREHSETLVLHKSKQWNSLTRTSWIFIVVWHRLLGKPLLGSGYMYYLSNTNDPAMDPQ